MSNEDLIIRLKQKYPDFYRFETEISHLANTVTNGDLEAAYKLATYDLKQKEYEEKLTHIKELQLLAGKKKYLKKEQKEDPGVSVNVSQQKIKAQCFQSIGGVITTVSAFPIIVENNCATTAVSREVPEDSFKKGIRQPGDLKTAISKKKEKPEVASLPEITTSPTIQEIIKEEKESKKTNRSVQYWVYQLGNNAVFNTNQLSKGVIPDSKG
jgi:hypothetical protein